MSEDPRWIEEHSNSSLKRLLPRIESRFKDHAEAAEWEAYVARLKRHFPRLFGRLHALYGAN